MYLKKEKVKKWVKKDVLNKKIRKKVKKEFGCLIQDFIELAQEHGWFWAFEEINYENVLKELTRQICYLLKEEKNVVNFGRLFTYKEIGEEGYSIRCGISYYDCK